MNEQVRIAAGSTVPPLAGFTATDFFYMMDVGAFADMRAELVEGVIEKMMPAFLAHGECNALVVASLSQAYRGLPFRLGIDLCIRIDASTVRAADIAVVVPNVPGDRAVEGREVVLAVEIADSTLRRDLVEKPDDYARSGVEEYWVIDLSARVVHIMRDCADGKFNAPVKVRFGEAITVPGTGQTIVID